MYNATRSMTEHEDILIFISRQVQDFRIAYYEGNMPLVRQKVQRLHELDLELQEIITDEERLRLFATATQDGELRAIFEHTYEDP